MGRGSRALPAHELLAPPGEAGLRRPLRRSLRALLVLLALAAAAWLAHAAVQPAPGWLGRLLDTLLAALRAAWLVSG